MPGFQPYPRPYEIMILISPDFTDEALDEAVDSVAHLISEHGGTVTNIKRDTPWGRRRLVYPIQRHRDATYVLYNFTSSPSSIVGFERDLKLDERVIRYLIVRDESKPSSDEEVEGEGEGEGAGVEQAEEVAAEAAGTPESDQAVAEAPSEAEAAAPVDAETATVVEDGDEVQPEAAEEPADVVADAETENALDEEAEPEPSEQGEQQ